MNGYQPKMDVVLFASLFRGYLQVVHIFFLGKSGTQQKPNLEVKFQGASWEVCEGAEILGGSYLAENGMVGM